MKDAPLVRSVLSAPLQDPYDARTHRRLVLVARVLLTLSAVGATLMAPLTGCLVALACAHLVVSVAAAYGRWRLARSLLFTAWSVCPGALVLLVRPDQALVTQLLLLGLAHVGTLLVITAMLALAPWRSARPWVGVSLGLLAASYGWSVSTVDSEAWLTTAWFVGGSLALVGVSLLPMWAILTDRARALRDSERARLAAHQLGEEALASNTAKSRFLANMSHELRTPLNAILGYLELVTEDAHDEGITDFDNDLGHIHDAGTHLLGLINAILDLSKIEAGKIEVMAEPCRPSDLVDELVSTVRPLAHAKQLPIHVDYGDLGVCRADPQKLRQVLLNLLSNAVKYTHTGQIRVAADHAAGELVVRVTDTGVGIPPSMQEAVFQAFERTDADITRRVGGTGLGLSISRKLTELLGGTLTVISEVERGSTFVLRCPVETLVEPEASERLPTVQALTMLTPRDDQAIGAGLAGRARRATPTPAARREVELTTTS